MTRKMVVLFCLLFVLAVAAADASGLVIWSMDVHHFSISIRPDIYHKFEPLILYWF